MFNKSVVIAIAQLHRECKNTAEAAGILAVGFTFFTDMFHEEKYSVFILLKDQCDVCVSFKYGNISQDDYDAQITKKDEARQEKTKDKESGNNTISVWSMDMQAILLCPRTKASSLYYKTKLQVHNFTLFNLNTKERYCYLLNETEGDLSSEVFAHLQYRHFERVIKDNPDLKEIVVWSGMVW